LGNGRETTETDGKRREATENDRKSTGVGLGGAIRLRKNTSLPLGVVVRAGDEISGEIEANGLEMRFFGVEDPLRAAHRRCAPAGG